MDQINEYEKLLKNKDVNYNEVPTYIDKYRPAKLYRYRKYRENGKINQRVYILIIAI